MQFGPSSPSVKPDAELDAAIEAEAHAAAESVRARRRVDLLLSLRSSPPAVPDGPLDETAAAAAVGASKVTFKRAKVEPDFFVGTRPRWRDAESVREKFAARGKKATTPEAGASPERAVDVDGDLGRAGLRVVGGGR